MTNPQNKQKDAKRHVEPAAVAKTVSSKVTVNPIATNATSPQQTGAAKTLSEKGWSSNAQNGNTTPLPPLRQKAVIIKEKVPPPVPPRGSPRGHHSHHHHHHHSSHHTSSSSMKSSKDSLKEAGGSLQIR